MAHEDQFLILTASWNHEELAILDGPTMSRLCVLTGQEPQPKPVTARYPGRFERGLRQIYRFLRRSFRPGLFRGQLLTSRGVDLLFCPFTAPTYGEPGIPVVSVIHDLQHRDCPQFLSPHEIDLRDAFLSDVCRRANAIICVSENTRQAVLRHLNINPEKTYTIHNCIQAPLVKPDPTKVTAHLVRLGIHAHPYMFYPANFWPHKNHRMLFTAYGMFLSRNPDKKIDLVLTGALHDLEEELKGVVRRMGLAERVHFLGFLPQDQVTAVWQGCEFLIFPSLYEGFGIPVLEAMCFGKPVLCSNSTSLPEVAGDAALYFDPRKPGDIVRCLERIVRDPALDADLVGRGRQRAASFHPEAMTRKYVEIFRSTIKDPGLFANTITGVFGDGWTGKEMAITYGPGPKNRVLEVGLEVPHWLPAGRVKLELRGRDGILQKWSIRRGREITIRHPLPEQQGYLTFSIAPTFRPSEYDMGPDTRSLGIMCRGCWLISPEQNRTSLLKGVR
jgi:glycosyltransferase involved in cell wall biosynthesis